MSTFDVNALSMSVKGRTMRQLAILIFLLSSFCWAQGSEISNPLPRTFGEQSTLALTAMGGSRFA